MFIAIITIGVLPDGRYFVPLDQSSYGGIMEERIIVAPAKHELHKKLRGYGVNPIQISRTIREIPPDGMDAVVREWDMHSGAWLWESDPIQ